MQWCPICKGLIIELLLFEQVNLNKMFWSKPQSLALAPDSPLRIEEPQYEGIQRLFLKLMLFYSKQSTSIRGANVIYLRVIHQIDRPAIYDGESLCSSAHWPHSLQPFSYVLMDCYVKLFFYLFVYRREKEWCSSWVCSLDCLWLRLGIQAADICNKDAFYKVVVKNYL